MRTHTKMLPLIAVLVLSAGCLQKETTHTLYLSPDGRVTWQSIEKDVASDEEDRVKRQAEEQDFLTAALAGTHPVASGLAVLDPASVRSRVTRAQRPFTVVTEASFGRVDRLIDRLLAELRIPGYARLTEEATRTTLTVHLDLAGDAGEDIDTPAAALLDELDRYRVVLTEGHFVGGVGFVVKQSGSVAVPDRSMTVANQLLDVSLTWER